MNRYDIKGWEVGVEDDQQNKFCLLPGADTKLSPPLPGPPGPKRSEKGGYRFSFTKNM